MPRDLIRIWFAERVAGHSPELDGEILTRPTLAVFDTGGTLMPVATVRISSDIISAVPITDNSHDLLYAQPGTPVRLRRSPTGRLEITGLSKRAFGAVMRYTLDISTGVVTSGATTDFSTHQVTLGELATATSGGFGETPLAAIAIVNASGTIIGLS